ncbi:MAG: WYL domain-containing protein [Balneolaceae bacterium]
MPVNRNALIRFRTIDNCLRNRQRNWTLNDLIDQCSEALYEYEGIEKGVSRRTIQSDIQLMRSDKLGYNAPIIVKDKKHYTYSDPEYTITNIPLTEQDMGTLNEVVDILKQFKGFSHFEDMDGMIKRLEDKVYKSKKKSRSIIDFERIEGLKGLHHLDELYQSVLNRKPLLMTYQSFRARKPGQFVFHPQFLKEYNNRWFVMGVKTKDSYLFNFALDRIVALEQIGSEDYIHVDVNPTEYFKNVVGVTVNRNMKPRIVRLFIDRAHAPYVLTKPIHPSQKLEKRIKDGVIITLEVQLNFELESKILGFGESVKVLAPDNLVQRINRKLRLAVKNYDNKSFPPEVDF